MSAKWLVALEKAPRASVILGSLGASLGISGFVWSIFMARGLNAVGQLQRFQLNYFVSFFLLVFAGEHVKTLSDDWKSANKEYMKFQKMNPIWGERLK